MKVEEKDALRGIDGKLMRFPDGNLIPRWAFEKDMETKELSQDELKRSAPKTWERLFGKEEKKKEISGCEGYYLDENGKKQDALFHAEMLDNEEANIATQTESAKWMKAKYMISDEELLSLYPKAVL